MPNLNNELVTLLNKMRETRPQERSELSRRYAVAITELEKVQAYFEVYVANYEKETART